MNTEYEVVWTGRMPLLPDREEHWDSRIAGMPSLDLEDGEAVEAPKRRYTRTGKHVGKTKNRQYVPKAARESSNG